MKALLARTLKPKIAARFGGRMKALGCGGAALNPDVGLFFDAMGLTLLQGYGQPATAPVNSCNRHRPGIARDRGGRRHAGGEGTGEEGGRGREWELGGDEG